MAEYKTPGVYIEEIPMVPSPIAQQPTSVAVFIGYTEKVADENGNDIRLKGLKTGSLLEFTRVFGDDPGEKYLHDSINLFYANGGSDCYIISAGSIHDPVSLNALSNALALIKNIPAQLLVIPDACLLSPAEFSLLQQQMLLFCADLHDRFAILDTLPPTNDLENDMQQFRTGIGNNNLQWGAAYYPWPILQNDKPVPPSGAMAGVYAMVDSSHGVWKAPANVSVNGIKDVTVHINDIQQQNMNVPLDGKAVNALRVFTGKGILIWGARTLDGNSQDWRYLSVRRTITMIEESIKQSTSWVVFEPNDANTWARVKAQVENFLITLWREAALSGAKANDAFFVNVGLGSTMTAADILKGRLIISIGLAVLRPAEFIIISFSHKIQQG
jgi:phage tail sheath protein FI